MAKNFKRIQNCTLKHVEYLKLVIVIHSSTYISLSKKMPDVQQAYNILRENTNARRRRYHSLKNSNAPLFAQQARKEYAKSVHKLLKIRRVLHRMKRRCKFSLRNFIKNEAELYRIAQTQIMSINK